jgi:signal transduction histidine kinase
MIRLRSLSSRLIIYWIAGSLLVFFSTPATVQIPLAFFLGADHFQALEVWTTKRARSIVIESLRRSPDGAIYVEATDALREHIRRNPDFRFVVFDPDTGALIRGSSEELAANFMGLLDHVEVFGSLFHLVRDPNSKARGYVRTTLTPFGRLGTIVYGSSFHWDDVIYQLSAYLVIENFLAYLPLCLVMSLVAFVVVRRALTPLRSIAAGIGQVDVTSLNRRIPTGDVPSELTPFVEAVNLAFERVKQGVARQRRFTANSAHELRTPIAILRGRVDKLDDTPLKHDIQRDVHRIQTILEQLLVLAQIEERGGNASPPELDLGEIVLSATADYMPIAVDNDRRIAFEGASTPIIIRAYRWAVESVVTNLIENAVRAERAGGTVLVRVAADATVEVIDHGEGIAPCDREAIFEPFWRKDDGKPGTGLGLAIAKELIDKLHGRLWVEETLGGGATFKISLPQVNAG